MSDCFIVFAITAGGMLIMPTIIPIAMICIASGQVIGQVIGAVIGLITGEKTAHEVGASVGSIIGVITGAVIVLKVLMHLMSL